MNQGRKIIELVCYAIVTERGIYSTETALCLPKFADWGTFPF